MRVPGEGGQGRSRATRRGETVLEGHDTEGEGQVMSEMMKDERGKRGLGRIYQRGQVWWIQYSFRGKKHRESSESEKESVAIKLLKKRLGEMGRGRLVGSAEEKLTVEQLADNLIVHLKT